MNKIYAYQYNGIKQYTPEEPRKLLTYLNKKDDTF